MGLTVRNVFGLLIRSKLQNPDDCKALFDRWQREAKNQAEDLERFRRWLVSHRYLTDYQAGLLCKGMADDFFLGDYKILDKLGRGRMAGVYKAVHNLGQVVAIKVLPPSKAKDPYLLSRFQREARLALKLNHPNVVRTYQMGEANKIHYIVMEYLEGETLDDVLWRRKKLPPAEAVRIAYQTLKGLQHIHDLGMVHRDLKPSNLMLTPARVPGQADTTVNASVKILDIGLGRMFFDENAPMPQEEAQLTGDGVLLGTPDYLAPEQARNARGVDIRADIYSVGCVLYHCLSGSPPFPDTNILNQIIRLAQEMPRRLKEYNAEVSDGLQQIIDYLMAKDAEQRYPTPERAAQALQVFLAAGADKIAAPGPDLTMSQYLDWVDKHSDDGGPPSRPLPQPALPVAKVVAPGGAPAAAPAAALSSPVLVPRRKRESGSKSGRKKHRKKQDREVPMGAPVAPPPGMDFDVELLPAGGKDKKKSKKMVLPVSAGAGLLTRGKLLIGLAILLALLVAVAAGGVLASGGIGPFLQKLGVQATESGGENKDP